MNYTIGILELNLFEVLGDPLFPKRYCSQVIIPLVAMLEAEERVRVTLTTTGSAVEYLAEKHPLLLQRIRTLITRGQIELLCSMYTNSDWQIFPSSDLKRSHRITNAILHRHGLPVSRTMVAQHNTYWPAMRAFESEFNVFLIRDTYIKARSAARAFPSMARVGNALLIVAANNFLHDMTDHLVSQKHTDSLGLFNEGRLETAVETWTHSDPRFVDITLGQDSWHWFHSTGAHHFTTGASLRNWEAFFCDRDWMRRVESFLAEKLNKGIVFRLVSELSDEADPVLQTLPDLGNPAWGISTKDLSTYWLEAPEQRMHALLTWTTLSWRSRTALRTAEVLAEKMVGRYTADALHEQLDALWRRQLWTEVSPVPSRANLSSEVDFIRDQAEDVISVATELCLQLGVPDSHLDGSNMWDFVFEPLEPCDGIVETKLINSEGTVKWFCNGKGLRRCEARFVAEEPACGIAFKLISENIAFSSCGYENQIATVSLSGFAKEGGILPSPTGLYGLGTDLYLIRHNNTVSVGASVVIEDSYIRFIVDFVPEGRQFEWPFTIVQGNAGLAMSAANLINAI